MYHWFARITPYHPPEHNSRDFKISIAHIETFVSLSCAEISSISVCTRTLLNTQSRSNKGLVQDPDAFSESLEVYILFPQLLVKKHCKPHLTNAYTITTITNLSDTAVLTQKMQINLNVPRIIAFIQTHI